MNLVSHIPSLLLRFFYAHNFTAVFVLVLIEEAGIPIPVPGDTLVMLAGARPHRTPLYDISMLLTASAAVFIGSSILYFVVRSKGRPLLERYGRYIHLNQRKLEIMERWFRRHGSVVIIFGRLIPGLRIPTTIMAGLSDIPYSVYAPTAAVAAVVWSVFYFFSGMLIRREWGAITGFLGSVLDLDELSIQVILLLVVVLAGTGWFAVRRGRKVWRQRKAGRQGTETELQPDTIRFVADGTEHSLQQRQDGNTRRA